jgi:hypothetical protein
MEVEADARRARKAAEASFLELLKSASPPLAPSSAWPDAEAALGRDARWAAVPDAARRRELFDAYLAAAAQLEAQRAARGHEALAALLRQLHPEPGTPWAEVGRRRGLLRAGQSGAKRGSPGARGARAPAARSALLAGVAARAAAPRRLRA